LREQACLSGGTLVSVRRIASAPIARRTMNISLGSNISVNAKWESSLGAGNFLCRKMARTIESRRRFFD
jgi:hypothetical protein